uniref:Bestrophin homolog n=1 Tax=Trichuris muris TaxID=70415 RepID=A0A5S6QLR0_TRIMR
MTVTYSLECSTSTLATFLKLLIRWKGSIYKLMYKEAIIYLSLYTILSLVYRFALNSEQREQFEKLSLFCERSLSFIPLTFILGFYVSMVVTRWWDVFLNIGWPDRIVLQVACYVQSADQKGRMIRRTVARYLNLAQTLVLRDISSAVKKRFPTMDMVIQSGFMNEEEYKQYDEVQCLHHKFWIPIQWCCTLLHKARKESLIENDLLLNQMIDDIMNYRQNLMMLLNYDWISVPLVYTQVVTIAVYGFFAASLMARQYLDPEKHYPGHIVDLYVPIFTILQFVFYMGWLKVAESLINPLGEDDDDFEINYIVERNLQAGYLICDENYGRIPPLERDIHWNDVQAEIPHTAASLGLKDNPQIGSASTIEVKPEKAELVPSDNEEARPEEGLTRFRKVSRAIMEGARRQFLRNNSQEFADQSPSLAGRRKFSKPLSHNRPQLDSQFSRSNSQRSSRRSVGKKSSVADGQTRESVSSDYNHLSPPADEWPKTSPKDSCRSTPSPIRLETISEGNSRFEEESSAEGRSPSPPPRGTSSVGHDSHRHGGSPMNTSEVELVIPQMQRRSSSDRPAGQDNPTFVVEDQDSVVVASQAVPKDVRKEDSSSVL